MEFLICKGVGLHYNAETESPRHQQRTCDKKQGKNLEIISEQRNLGYDR